MAHLAGLGYLPMEGGRMARKGNVAFHAIATPQLDISAVSFHSGHNGDWPILGVSWSVTEPILSTDSC
jgi:hypothetical protein